MCAKSLSWPKVSEVVDEPIDEVVDAEDDEVVQAPQAHYGPRPREQNTMPFVSRTDGGAVTVLRADSTMWHTSKVHPDPDQSL